MFEETNQAEEQKELSLPENLFEGETHEAPETRENEETLKIKYNGEEREISLSEARTLAQKGMNYDHVVAERDTKFSRELAALDKAAEERGMTRTQYVETIENAALERESRESARAKIEEISQNAGFSGAWGNLFRKYPELSRTDAKEMLSADVSSGMSPLEAYQERLLREKENELSITRASKSAGMRSAGSMATDAARYAKDDFLEGFSIE